MDAEESKNHSTGWNVYGGGGLRIPFVPGIGVSYSDVRQTATSKTTTALADVNGDRKTDIIISEIAKEYGLEHIYTLKRNILNKAMPSLNSPTNKTGVKSSTMTTEHIVILKKTV